PRSDHSWDHGLASTRARGHDSSWFTGDKVGRGSRRPLEQPGCADGAVDGGLQDVRADGTARPPTLQTAELVARPQDRPSAFTGRPVHVALLGLPGLCVGVCHSRRRIRTTALAATFVPGEKPRILAIGREAPWKELQEVQVRLTGDCVLAGHAKSG